MEKILKKNKKYYDIPIVLNVVIAAPGDSLEEAAKKLYSLDESELIELLYSQIHLMDLDEAEIAH